MGWPVEIPVFFVGCERKEQEHDIAQNHHDPVATCQDSMKHETRTQAMVSIEVEIESFVVRTIAKMVPQMPLPNQMERRGEKQRHQRACCVVPGSVREEHGVLGLVNNGIYRIHHDAKGERQTGEAPTAARAGRRVTADRNGRKLPNADSKIEFRGNVRGNGEFASPRCVWKFRRHNDSTWQIARSEAISKSPESH